MKRKKESKRIYSVSVFCPLIDKFKNYKRKKMKMMRIDDECECNSRSLEQS
jgi:hypothetical protein